MNKAVFLSYASQDTEIARKLCESLRQGGMEVWLDADGGLEHGDEWDAKIRRQIKECVLFLPLISANTQARLEGYFRIEWELAAERAMGIVAGVPFILPIVIDGTREPDALVPDRFRKVQWTRLPGGVVPPEVQARLVKIWKHRTGALGPEAPPSSGARSGSLLPPASPSERGLAAVMFTDIVGYSARMQRDETGTLGLVQADFATMRVRCTGYGGEVLNTMGDGLLMCFSSPVQAVTCALEIQADFGRRRSLLSPEQNLEHRIGIHIGDVIRQETGGIAGDGVNIASRLEGKAPPGGVCISQVVYDLVKGKVPMQASFLGPESFKNITEPISIWHVAPADGSAPERPATTGGKPRIPDYELLRQIGRGSYGDVWLARGATGVWRAIKVVWRTRFADAEPFEREWRGLKEFAAISLGESTQMNLLHVGRNDEAGFFYYVMELADDAERGRAIEPASYVPLTLAHLRTSRQRVPASDCVRYGTELARALAGLHRRGLLHSDVKPSNIILVEGVPKLADIGLVARTTAAATFVGTEGFVPPEGPGSPSADVFALGKVLYELSTGEDRHDFPRLPASLDSLPDRQLVLALNSVIQRACDAQLAQRYPDAGAMLADLQALQAGQPLPGRRRGPMVGLAAAAAIALVAGGAWFALRRPPAVPLPPAATVAPAPNRPTPEVAVQVPSAPKAAPAPGQTAPQTAPEPGQSASPDRSKADPRSRATELMERPRGLAVLPFENLDAAEQAFFASGVTEEIHQHLSKVRSLRVLSPKSLTPFKAGVADLLGACLRAGEVPRPELIATSLKTARPAPADLAPFVPDLKIYDSLLTEVSA